MMTLTAGRAVARVPDGGGTAVYRGWMLASDRYAAFAAALAGKGVVLRDYVKSMKHYWDEAAYIPDAADHAAAWKVAARFLALRADGTWRVIELGYGQVSDRPASTEPAKFLSAALTA